MLDMPKPLLNAFESYSGTSGIKIYCDKNLKKEVKKFFNRVLKTEWEKAARQLYEEEFEDGEMTVEELMEYFPISTKLKDYGVYVDVASTEILGSDDVCWDLDYGSDALEKALDVTIEKFKGSYYCGYIHFMWSTTLSGEYVDFYLHSNNIPKEAKEEDLYDFIGIELNDKMETQSCIWDTNVEQNIKELTFALLGEFNYFKTNEDLEKYIKSLNGNVTDTIDGNTDYLICDKKDLRRKKIKNAIKNEVTVINEDEFIAKFGNREEFLLRDEDEDDFFESFEEDLIECDYYGFTSVVDYVDFFKKYISDINLQKWYRTIVEIAYSSEEMTSKEVKKLEKYIEEKRHQ